MKIKILILSLALFTSNLTAQSWIRSNILIGNSDLTEIQSTTDENGNIYVLGFFTGTVSGGSYELTTKGLRDYVVAKFDTIGNVKWIKQLGSTSFEYVGGAIQVMDDHFFVTGGFRNDLYYTDVDYISSAGGFDIFLAKYDTTGAVQWCKNVGEGTANQRADNVIIDESGNVILSGFFTTDITIGSDTTLNSSDGFDDAFYSSFDTDGNHVWSKQIKSISSLQYPSIYNCIPIGSDYLFSGIYSDSIIIDEDTLVSKDQTYDIFLFRTDANGQPQWYRTIGGDSIDYTFSITTDPFDDIYIGGYYNSAYLTIDSTETDTVHIDGNSGSYDLLIMNYLNTRFYPIQQNDFGFLYSNIFLNGRWALQASIMRLIP